MGGYAGKGEQAHMSKVCCGIFEEASSQPVSEYQERIPRGRSSTSSGTCGSNGLTREIDDVVNLACLILSLKRGIVMHCAGGRKAIASLSGKNISGASSFPP